MAKAILQRFVCDALRIMLGTAINDEARLHADYSQRECNCSRGHETHTVDRIMARRKATPQVSLPVAGH